MKLLGLRIFGEYEPVDTDRPNLLSILPPPTTSAGDSLVHVKPLPRPFQSQPLSFDKRIWLLAFFTGFPGALVALIMLWSGEYTPKVQWTLTVFIISFWLGCAYALRERVVMPLQTLSNLLAALREGGPRLARAPALRGCRRGSASPPRPHPSHRRVRR